MTARPRLWVEVATRAELDSVRRSSLADVCLITAGAPIYGRPQDRLCVIVSDADLRGPAGVLAAKLPVRAGALVAATPAGIAFIDELRGRGRGPLAVSVGTVAETRQAAARGVTDVVVDDALVAGSVREAAVDGRVGIIVRVGSTAAARDALSAGVDGLLVAAALLPEIADTPSLAASLAPSPVAVRSAPSTGTQAMARAPRQATIGAVLDRAARLHGADDAVVHVVSGERFSYARLRTEARRVGRALMACGVMPGDRIVVWGRNVTAWPLVQLGAAYAGAILVTANPALADEEITFIVAQSEAVVLLAGPHPGPRSALLERMARGATGEHLRTVITLPDTEGVAAPVLSWSGFLEGAPRVSEAELDHVAGRAQPDDVTTILYTSGTTGFPKGAQLTHRGMLQNAAAVGGNLRLEPTDRICLAVPFHHCFGIVMGTLAAMTYGACLVLPSDGFDAGSALAAVANERCTIIYGVPTMFSALLDHPALPDVDLSSLRTGIVAGSPVAPELARRIARELHVAGLIIAYGLTEASPVVTQTSPDDPVEIRLGTVGRPIVGAEVRAIDPQTGAEAAIGAPGELQTRGPMVMRGYFEMPDETNASIDRDGWLHTGDLAIRDAQGVWSIVGRLKDMIIRGGENIYPAEVEAAGRRIAGVADLYVVGVPSDYYGEEVFAWVRRSPGADLTEDAVRSGLAEHLARFQVPAYIRFTDELPLTGSGKVMRHALREQAIATRGDGQARGSDSRGRLGLPLLPPKSTSLGGRGDAVGASSSATGSAGSDGDSRRDDRRSTTDLPPRPGWSRPDRAAWRWQPRRRIPEQTTQEGNVSLDDVRRRGQRIKTWGIGDNVRAQIESTGEEPIMYKALGTPPQTHHPFNLYGDIKSQPDALRGTFEHGDEISQVARTLADRDFAGMIGLGSGTSQFVAQVANAAFAKFAGMPGWDYDSQAFLRYPPPLDYSRILAVAYSGSGSTVDTVAAARDCRTRGSYTLSFTSVEGSPIVQATDARILTAGGFDTGGSDTFHYTTRVAAAIYLALEVGRLRDPNAHDYEALKRQLLDTPRMMADMFDSVDKRCRTIADMFLGVRSILVVGAGANFGTAEEIALKFDEMAHIPAKSMNPGRHIHGALGLTEESILTILVAPPGTAYEDLHDIAKVTQLLKSPAVAIVADEDSEIADIVDYVVRIPIQDEVLFSVLAVLPGQLLPYWCGVGLGLNPDTQRSNVPKHARVWNMLFPPGTH